MNTDDTDQFIPVSGTIQGIDSSDILADPERPPVLVIGNTHYIATDDWAVFLTDKGLAALRERIRLGPLPPRSSDDVKVTFYSARRREPNQASIGASTRTPEPATAA